jgi:hypothetical protein
MKKILSILLFSVYGIHFLLAEHVSSEKALKAATLVYNNDHRTTLRNDGEPTMRQVWPDPKSLRADNEVAWYVFVPESSAGFVIIAGDDRVMPVIGHSAENDFDPDNLPPAFKDWMQTMTEAVDYAKTHEDQACETVAKAWDDLLSGKAAAQPDGLNSEEYLIKTQWHQDFRKYAPCNSPTGCVITALAQIMNYWRYPQHGTGSHSYEDANGTCRGTYGVDFTTADYKWCEMNQYSESGAELIAELMFHIGVAIDTDYETHDSSASIYDENGRQGITTALPEYFGYKKPQLRQRKNYNDGQWTGILKYEINDRRPIIYTGYPSGLGTGHTFIIDWYNDNEEYHINWGWNGSCNGYYAINILNPSRYEFNWRQEALIGIEPVWENKESVELKSLAVSGAILSPQFSPENTHYRVNIPAETETVKVDAESKLSCAWIYGLWNYPVLPDSTTSIEVGVSLDGYLINQQQKYVIDIHRASENSADIAKLQHLFATSPMYPHFNPQSDIDHFTIILNENTDRLNLIAIADENDKSLVAGDGWKNIEPGVTNFEISVVAEDGINVKKYFIEAVRLPKSMHEGAYQQEEAIDNSLCSAPSAEGFFGENSHGRWTLCENGTLFIDGNGEIPENFLADNPGIDLNQIAQVIVNEGITAIGQNAFANFQGMYYIKLPTTATLIGAGAFSGCSMMQSIILPESIAKIDNNAFRNCTSLIEMQLPQNLTEVSDSCFQGCTQLSTVVLPTSPTRIGAGAFADCTSLAGLALPATITEIGDRALAGCVNLTSIELPASLNSISNGLFSGCTSLQELVIPNSVTSIGESAFEDCAGLVEITIPAAVKVVGRYAFRNCNNLKNIILSNSDIFLSEMTFYDNKNLASLHIPASLSLHPNFIESCSNLKFISVEWEDANALPDVDWAKIFNNRKVKTILYVPCGKAEIYENNKQWAYFQHSGGGIIDNCVIVDLVGLPENNGVKLDIGVNPPSDADFTLHFTVGFPSGLSLDGARTALASEFASRYRMRISMPTETTWHFMIEPDFSSGLRLSPSSQNIVGVAVNIDRNKLTEDRDISITGFNYISSNGTTINKERMEIGLDAQVSLIDLPANTGAKIWAHHGALHIELAKSERITVCNLTGQTVLSKEFAAGESVINLPAGVYIVKTTGRTVKVVIEKSPTD